MNNNFNYIRYGVHKDKHVLRDMRKYYAGLVIPAHIISYSTSATIAAIGYIDKPYIVDPMTYILASEDLGGYVINKKTSKKEFKPSISKMVNAYGLGSYFERRAYKPLEIGDFTNKFIEKLVSGSLNLQLEMIDDEKKSAIKKYKELLEKVGEGHTAEFITRRQKPEFVTTPYFYFDSMEDEWLEINRKIALQARKFQNDYDIVPILLTNADCLCTY